MKKTSPLRQPAIERLREHAPDGPPFIGLMLDEATVRCLAAGAVNSRAEVAARKAIAAFEAHTLVIEPTRKVKRA